MSSLKSSSEDRHINNFDFITGKSTAQFVSTNYKWPLIKNNITTEDKKILSQFILKSDKFTQGPMVQRFEKDWSHWLGVKYSVFVNSGSAANFLTMAALAELYGKGEVIVPPLTWVSDITSVLSAGHKPVFVDINQRTLAIDEDLLEKKINSRTRAIFLTHVLGLNGLTEKILRLCRKNKIALIEDVCESHGAKFKGKKLGSFGLASNFSFYYGHHMTTIEGGIVSTNDFKIYQYVRMMRAHGLLREAPDAKSLRNSLKLNSKTAPWPEFTFPVSGFNFRSTELNAVLGINQLKRLDKNNMLRRENFQYFLSVLNPKIFFTDFLVEGNSNYSLLIVLNPDKMAFQGRLVELLKQEGVEFRRGLSGGGNQIRQPYLKGKIKARLVDFPVVEWIHNGGFYIGNFPDLKLSQIRKLAQKLNHLEFETT